MCFANPTGPSYTAKGSTGLGPFIAFRFICTFTNGTQTQSGLAVGFSTQKHLFSPFSSADISQQSADSQAKRWQ